MTILVPSYTTEKELAKRQLINLSTMHPFNKDCKINHDPLPGFFWCINNATERQYYIYSFAQQLKANTVLRSFFTCAKRRPTCVFNQESTKVVLLLEFHFIEFEKWRSSLEQQEQVLKEMTTITDYATSLTPTQSMIMV